MRRPEDEERTAMHLAIGLDLIDRIPMLPSKRRLARKRKPSRINRPMRIRDGNFGAGFAYSPSERT